MSVEEKKSVPKDIKSSAEKVQDEKTGQSLNKEKSSSTKNLQQTNNLKEETKPKNESIESSEHPKSNSNESVKHVLKTPRGIQKWPNQVVEIQLKKGFYFNVMFIGEPSCGKKTFFHSLFDIKGDLKTVDHESGEFEIAECKTTNPASPITIKAIITKNYNKTLDHEGDIKKILGYIEESNKKYLQSETKFKLTNDEDPRIHLIFFMMTSLNSINEGQLSVLKALSHLNLVPVLAKSDTMTDKERKTFKETFHKMISEKNIELFKFPENMTYREENKKINPLSPYCVLGSMDFIDGPNGQKRARSYSFGIIDVVNPKHSEFSIICETVINHNLVNLVKLTDQGTYAKFRADAFQAIKINDENKESSIDLIAKYVNNLRHENEQETHSMKQNYEEISRVEERKFKEKENEINQEYEEKIRVLKEKIAELEESLKSQGSIKKKR